MTKKFLVKLKQRLTSLRLRFLVVFAFALAIAFSIFIGIDAITNLYIEKVYMSEENQKERIKDYFDDLQEYVLKNNITAENIDEISNWSRDNRYVYLLIDGTKIFWGNSNDKDKEEDKKPSDSQGGTACSHTDENDDGICDKCEEEIKSGEGDEPVCEHTDENTDGICDKCAEEIKNGEGDGTEGGTQGGSQSGSQGGNQGGNTGSGITVEYPTLEELFEKATQSAQENGGMILKLCKSPNAEFDSIATASFVDYSEFLYYDISNIASVVIAAIAITLIMLLYIRVVTNRIIKLGDAVNSVASGEVNKTISASGNDEIAELASNVETLRSTMVENYNKEKAALKSNTELITSMSHDIRTPLTVLLGYIDVMRLHSENDDVMQGYLKAAESTAMRLKKLSDDMFGYFLVFGGKDERVELETYDAATLVDQMISEHILLMKENGYDIVVEPVAEPESLGATVSTNAAYLLRIFDNAFSNINKYADKKNPVKIRISLGACSVKVSFTNHIRRDGEKVESNGIGLKTCAKLAEMIGAAFKTTTDGECFTLELELPTDKEKVK